MGQTPDIFPRLEQAVRRTFPAAQHIAIERTTTSADIDGWDSLSHSILIMNLEDAFGIDLPLDRVYALADLGDLADLVESSLRGAAAEKPS